MLLGSILSCSVCAHIRYTATTSQATPPTTTPTPRRARAQQIINNGFVFF